MTVKELILRLAEYPLESIVILQKDAEGNGYSPLARIEETRYRAHNTYSGETTSRPKDTEPCVVLRPVN